MSMVKHKRGTSSTLDVQHEAELKVLANKFDEDIGYSDIPSSSDEQWSNAERGKFYRPLKTQASVSAPDCSPSRAPASTLSPR